MATDKFEHATFYLTKNQVDQIKELAKATDLAQCIGAHDYKNTARQDENKRSSANSACMAEQKAPGKGAFGLLSAVASFIIMC